MAQVDTTEYILLLVTVTVVTPAVPTIQFLYLLNELGCSSKLCFDLSVSLPGVAENSMVLG
jgi:hypothetical protein